MRRIGGEYLARLVFFVHNILWSILMLQEVNI